MLASAHIAAGFVAGLASASSTGRARRIFIALLLGLASHAILDAIPHSDYAFLSRSTALWVVALESLAICLLAMHVMRPRLLPRWPEYLLPGVVGAVVLDAKFAAPLVLPAQPANWVALVSDAIHSFFHAAPPASARAALAVEFVCLVLLLALLMLLSRRALTGATSSQARQEQPRPRPA